MKFHDSIQITPDKKATIMRDGSYQYLAAEIGDAELNPNELITVYRPKEEVEKAYKRFVQLGKLPVIYEHPNFDLDLSSPQSYTQGEASEPDLISKGHYTIIDCSMILKDKALEEYEDGTKELSCGWEGKFIKVDDKWIQIFQDINHIALVDKGRCGTICKINDGGQTMAKEIKKIKDADETEKEEAKEPFHVEMDTEKLAAFLVFAGVPAEQAKEKVSEFLAQKKDEMEKEEKEKEKEKEEVKDEDESDKDESDKKTKDEDEADEDKKVKDEDEEEKEEEEKKKVKDAAIVDTKRLVISRFGHVLPVIASGAIKINDAIGKTPCEIKSMFIKKVLGREIKDSDPSLDGVFEIAKDLYKNEKWEVKVQDSDVSLADKINKINFKEGN